MKNLTIIFVVAALALTSCKTSQLSGLASNTSDDVYYNPAKDHKANVAPETQQQYVQNRYANPNAGKIGATAADQNNPYYQDPKFNYDDYYDNAYASRVKRFNNPLYGTGYYDSYYTNSYFYNNNPSYYGTSIYSSYNMGPSYGYGNGMGYGSGMNYGMGMGYGMGSGMGYYSPSQTFWNAYYNPYYSGYGMSYGMGYGSGYNPYGMGYGMGYGYNPYSMYNMGYGCGGYNPYGYGYSPYGYSPYGYGYGMGYGSPLYSTAYYNSYDYNSSTYQYGPRGTHTGGNSATSSPMPSPRHLEINNSGITSVAAPFSQQRFSQVQIPKETYAKIQELKNPVNAYPSINNGGGAVHEGRPSYNYGNSPDYNNSGVNVGRPSNNNNGMYNNSYPSGNAGSVNVGRPSQPAEPSNNYGGYSSGPRLNGINSNPGGGTSNYTPSEPPRQHKWFSGSNWSDNSNSGGNSGWSNNNSWNNNSNSSPSQGRWNESSGGGSWGGNSGGSWGGGGGGIVHPRR